MISEYYDHPRAQEYDFGPRHPLKPERLQMMNTLLDRFARVQRIDPGRATINDVLRVHSDRYVEAIRQASVAPDRENQMLQDAGLGPGDNPPFAGMLEASLGYVGLTVGAACNVRDRANLAIAIAGGLHHAQRDRASGFCIFNDPAIAISILRERFVRVAYIDIDVHHGDGVQHLFEDDPSVLTCSIHETGRRLYPGTGFESEFGVDGSVINVPLPPGATGDTWLWAFHETILPAVQKFTPGAIVLQMGADSHFSDPLAHLQNTVQEWLQAVVAVRDLKIPLVAVGGGGYDLRNVPRMWTAAVLSLCEIEVPAHLPSDLAEQWGQYTMFDPAMPEPRWAGRYGASRVVEFLQANHPLLA